MSNIVSALQGAAYKGYVDVADIGPLGMITVRGDHADSALTSAMLTVTGLQIPALRRIVTNGTMSVGWMSPDELLIVLPYDQVSPAIAALQTAMAGRHFLAVDVSDARAVFTISGPATREVLAKLCPTDLSPAVLSPGELRRTRVAQVAAAFWIGDDGVATLVSFRSVAAYVFGVLQSSATPGSEVGLF